MMTFFSLRRPGPSSSRPESQPQLSLSGIVLSTFEHRDNRLCGRADRGVKRSLRLRSSHESHSPRTLGVSVTHWPLPPADRWPGHCSTTMIPSPRPRRGFRDATRMLSRLRTQGYATITLTSETENFISETLQYASRIFEDESKKTACKFRDAPRFPRGYLKPSSRREIITTSVGFECGVDKQFDDSCSKLIQEPDRTSDGWSNLSMGKSLGYIARHVLVKILMELYDCPSLDLIQRVSECVDGTMDTESVPRPSILTISNVMEDGADLVATPPHVDRGLITLIISRQGQGLEVRKPNCSEWQPVEAPGCLVVIPGHLLSRTTDGQVPASEHRVVVTGPRLSLAYKLLPPEDAKISWCGVLRKEYRPLARDIMDELDGSINAPRARAAAPPSELAGCRGESRADQRAREAAVCIEDGSRAPLPGPAAPDSPCNVTASPPAGAISGVGGMKGSPSSPLCGGKQSQPPDVGQQRRAGKRARHPGPGKETGKAAPDVKFRIDLLLTTRKERIRFLVTRETNYADLVRSFRETIGDRYRHGVFCFLDAAIAKRIPVDEECSTVGQFLQLMGHDEPETPLEITALPNQIGD